MSIRNSYLYHPLHNLLSWIRWQRRRFEAPSPEFIKRSVLLRNGLRDSTWVETGTYLGETTRHLAKWSPLVYSLEPEPSLFAHAVQRFEKTHNVRILKGTSEAVLPALLPTLSGSINFWLDGHYSAGVTFKGPQDTPVADELNCIAKNLAHFDRVCVLIDDVRLFAGAAREDTGYPPLDYLVTWANENGFRWHVEQDVFVAKR